MGRIVIYRFGPSETPGPNASKECPAIVTAVFSDNCVNLRLLVDGAENLPWKTSVLQQEKAEQGATWRWPERVDGIQPLADPTAK
jgi:hypothetical protein